jgi:hypothetical protein
MHRTLALLAAASVAGTSPLASQKLPATSIQPGARVRVTGGMPARRYVGSLVAVDGDSLRLAGKRGEVEALPLRSVIRLEQSAGRRPNYTKGALIGGGVGLALGLGVGAVGNGLAEGGCEGPGDCGNLGQSLAIGGAVGAGLGAGIGVLLATVFKGERWQPVAGLAPGQKIGLRLWLQPRLARVKFRP